jgi:hypothetical protein
LYFVRLDDNHGPYQGVLFRQKVRWNWLTAAGDPLLTEQSRGSSRGCGRAAILPAASRIGRAELPSRLGRMIFGSPGDPNDILPRLNSQAIAAVAIPRLAYRADQP